MESNMDKYKRNRWLVWGGAAVLVLGTGAGVAVYAGKSADAKQTASKEAGDKKKEPPLEFAAREVTQPQMARSAGQSLGELDLEELRYRVAERRASLEAAQAQFQQAERSFHANEDLAAKSFISSTALDNFRATMESARGQWLAAKAQLETAQSSLRLASLVAPISGVVAKRLAVPGEKLSAEQQVLSIVDLGRLELAGLVGTHEVGRLKPGMAVSVKVEGDEQPVKARIARIAPAAEPGTRSIGVTLEIANVGERFRAGQYGVAHVELPDGVERLTLPATAVINASGQDHVWVLEKNALVRRVVTTGRRDTAEGRVEILQGIKAEDRVLAARFDNLRDGAAAKVVDAAAPRVASAAASAPAVQ
jgi:RND family efflux transporter MFP subunit